jgi:hypothetical protein
MKGLPRLGVYIVLLLFGILQRVIRLIMKFLRRKKLVLTSSEVRMGSGDLEKTPLLP